MGKCRCPCAAHRQGRIAAFECRFRCLTPRPKVAYRLHLALGDRRRFAMLPARFAEIGKAGPHAQDRIAGRTPDLGDGADPIREVRLHDADGLAERTSGVVMRADLVQKPAHDAFESGEFIAVRYRTMAGRDVHGVETADLVEGR